MTWLGKNQQSGAVTSRRSCLTQYSRLRALLEDDSQGRRAKHRLVDAERHHCAIGQLDKYLVTPAQVQAKAKIKLPEVPKEWKWQKPKTSWPIPEGCQPG